MKTDVMARIDRDFPHQVLLPLKLDADTEEDVIWWLDRRIGRWDMYVDLNQRFIRYCFYEEKDANAFREAMRKADFQSVRGKFAFGPNQHPIQNWYALKVERGDDGKPVLKTVGEVFADHGDAYSAACKL